MKVIEDWPLAEADSEDPQSPLPGSDDTTVVAAGATGVRARGRLPPLAVCDGLMLQWIADPQATPNAAETLDALRALGTLASIGANHSAG
jgi:hypothetical protein